MKNLLFHIASFQYRVIFDLLFRLYTVFKKKHHRQEVWVNIFIIIYKDDLKVCSIVWKRILECTCTEIFLDVSVKKRREANKKRRDQRKKTESLPSGFVSETYFVCNTPKKYECCMALFIQGKFVLTVTIL